MYLLNYRLSFVTPGEVAEQLFWLTKQQEGATLKPTIIERQLVEQAYLASYLLLHNCKYYDQYLASQFL